MYGFGGLARNSPIATMALSLGPLLIPALVALMAARKASAARVAQRRGHDSRSLSCSISSGYRGTLRILDFVPVNFCSSRCLASRPCAFARLAQRSRAMAAIAATLLIAIGLPTTLIDDFNAQDIGNREMGPGFRWTIC